MPPPLQNFGSSLARERIEERAEQVGKIGINAEWKYNVVVIFKAGHAQFTMVPFELLSDQKCERYQRYYF